MGSKPKPINRGEAFTKGKSLYAQTGNILYAVVAIGERPKNPPLWAVEACKSYAKQYESTHYDIVRLEQVVPFKPHPDDKILKEVAERQVSKGESIKAAVEHASEDTDPVNIRRLQRKVALETTKTVGEYGEIVEHNSRFNRIMERIYGNFVPKATKE
jgi:hypothetical protein